jgi:hypothetical protein
VFPQALLSLELIRPKTFCFAHWYPCGVDEQKPEREKEISVLVRYIADVLNQDASFSEPVVNALRVLAERISYHYGLLEADATTSEVIYALDPALDEWTSGGFSYSEHLIWSAFGFKSHEATQWKNSNVSLHDALVWKGVKPSNFSKWNAMGVKPSTAIEWESKGCDPDEAKIWGNTIPWGTVTILRSLGPAEHIAPLYKENYMSVDEVLNWVTSDVPIEDSWKWMRKGYALNNASKLHAEGKRVEDMKDLKEGEFFATPSWKRISKAARENGWEISGPFLTPDQNEAPRISMTFSRGDDEILYGLFSTSGRFRQVSASKFSRWDTQSKRNLNVRTVDEFIAQLSKPPK